MCYIVFNSILNYIISVLLIGSLLNFFLAAGILKGYDALLNLVLDNATEFLRDPEDSLKITDETRNLGLIVARGTAITVIAPNDGIEQIANPFMQAD